MNVRFSAGTIRCRATHAELEHLLSSGSLCLSVALPRRHSLQVTVRSVALSSWQLDSDPTGIWIAIPRAELELLLQSLPSREGVRHVFAVDDADQLQLSFEVDVRKRRQG